MPLIPIRSNKAPRLSAAAQVAQLFTIPAPVGGLNYRDPISQMDPTDALVLDNFIPTQTGAELRKGWRYHTDTVSAPIRSVFAYNAANPEDNKLFAAAGGDIYDVTTNPPTMVVSAAGDDYWYTTQFSNGSGVYLLAVSPGGGYWTYDGTSWTQQTVTGLPANPTSVMVWKNRVWFTVHESSSVYYLDTVDAITGSATGFEMGSLLRNGGYVRGLINWTVDAGVSFDDFLVMVGSQGDIGVWQGTDPTSASTFSLKGVWYVGPVPTKGKFFTSYGGDVMIVSELGLVPMSLLINGQFTDFKPGPAAKVQSVLSPLITKLRTEPAFDVLIVPSSNVLVIKLPQNVGIYQQFAMNVNTAAWCTFSGMPMECCTLLNGQLYFGTLDGRIAKGLYGDQDEVERNGTGGTAVQGDLQTAFNAFNTPAQLKKFGLARPIFIAPEAPSVKLRVNTQYTFSNVAGSPSFVQSLEGRWDQSNWNAARWVGAANTYQAWVGATGLGYYAALRMKVRGKPGTIFTSSHIMTELGGVM